MINSVTPPNALAVILETGSLLGKRLVIRPDLLDAPWVRVTTTTTTTTSNFTSARVRSPRHQLTTKMKTSEKQLYNALAYLVIFGKQLKNTLEELTFAIEKSESLLIAHNLKTSTRSKK